VKRDAILKTIAAVLEGHGDAVAAAYLFGSTAKGDVGPLGDVDVAVLFSEQASASLLDLKLRLHADLCRALKRNDVDLLILNTASNLIIKDEIVRNGVVIFEGNPEAREEFELRVIHLCIDFKTQRRKAVGY
jgi:predicted nucleotidyltransferase